jgi:membrane-associated protease RseP (regulator of RpoE activity)
VPITTIGLALSTLQPISELAGGIRLGSSLLFAWLSRLFFPEVPAGYDVILHPMAFAGWLGFFVTAMNLMPLGQLDGGHIAYAVLGRYQRPVIIGFILCMIALGILWPGWWFWAILVMVLGLHHPPPQDEITPLSSKEFILAGIGILIFILSFIPVPFPMIPS